MIGDKPAIWRCRRSIDRRDSAQENELAISLYAQSPHRRNHGRLCRRRKSPQFIERAARRFWGSRSLCPAEPSPELAALTTHRAWLGAAAIGAAAAAISAAYTIRRWSLTQSSSGRARTVLPRVLKWPAPDAPFASSKRETRWGAERARRS